MSILMDAYLNSILVMHRTNRDAALDMNYNTVDDLILHRQMAEVDLILQKAAKMDLPIAALLSFLTITLAYKTQFAVARDALVEAVHNKAKEHYPPHDIKKMLKGLV
jgi:hypothetical protein